MLGSSCRCVCEVIAAVAILGIKSLQVLLVDISLRRLHTRINKQIDR